MSDGSQKIKLPQSDARPMKVVALVKPGFDSDSNESFIFIYEDQHSHEVIQQAYRWASDPTLNFTDVDARLLQAKVLNLEF